MRPRPIDYYKFHAPNYNHFSCYFYFFPVYLIISTKMKNSKFITRKKHHSCFRSCYDRQVFLHLKSHYSYQKSAEAGTQKRKSQTVFIERDLISDSRNASSICLRSVMSLKNHYCTGYLFSFSYRSAHVLYWKTRAILSPEHFTVT